MRIEEPGFFYGGIAADLRRFPQIKNINYYLRLSAKISGNKRAI